MMKKLFLAAYVILIPSILYAADLAEEIDQLIHTTLPNATVGIEIEALDGAVIYGHQSQTLLYPASNIKLYTAAAALYALGPNYHYETILAELGDERYITFSGAPDLKSSDLQTLLHPVSNLPGNLIIDATHFSGPPYLAGTSYDDMGWYFAAPCSAVILDENKEDYTVDATKGRGAFVHFSPLHNPAIVKLLSTVKTVSPLVASDHCSLDVTVHTQNELELEGCLAQQQQPTTMSFAVTDPIAMATQRLQQTLKAQFIPIHGHIVAGTTPSTAKVINRHFSASLSQLIDVMLLDSNNLYAESLTRTLGYQLHREGSTKQGVYAIKSILQKETGMDMRLIHLADGVGTRYNMSTASHIASLLRHIYTDSKIQAPFLHALPVMGVSGSLKNRMQGTTIANQVWAKTGSMHDMSALSGFIHTLHGKTLVFSIIVNGVSQASQAKAFEDKLLTLIYRHTR